MRQIGRFTTAVLLAGLLSFTSGCDRGSSRSSEEVGPSPPGEQVKKPGAGEEFTILCGSSFRPPMEKLVELFEEETGIRALLSFGGSEDHLPKVKLKSVGDVYVTHTPYMQYTREAGALLREVEVGFLAPVLVVAKGNPKKLTRFEDLAQGGLKVVLPNPEYSTCGEMVSALLQRKGIQAAVLENVGGALVKDHATVGNQLKLGTREAGIMWNGVAHTFRHAIDIIPLPYEYDSEIRVAVLGLSYSQKGEIVRQFLDFVEDHGREVFAEFGYVK